MWQRTSGADPLTTNLRFNKQRDIAKGHMLKATQKLEAMHNFVPGAGMAGDLVGSQSKKVKGMFSRFGGGTKKKV